MQQFLIEAFIIVLLFFVFYKLFGKPKFFPREVYPSNKEVRLSLVSITCIALVAFSTSVDNATPGLHIPVVKKYSMDTSTYPIPIVKEYENVTIENMTYLKNKTGDLKTTLIALLINDKSNFLDSLFVLVVCIIATIGFWNLDFKSPFNIRISLPLYWIGGAFMIYAFLSYLGFYFAHKYTWANTNKEYDLYNRFPFSYFFKFWLGGIIFRLAQIIKAAEKLKKEQDLTI
jgi:hypothetical protein